MTKSLIELTVEDVAKTGVNFNDAREILNAVRNTVASGGTAPEIWRAISKGILMPCIPFELHQLLYDSCYSNWDENQHGPRPVWIPSKLGATFTNLARFMTQFNGDAKWLRERSGDPVVDYALLQKVSVDSPEAFWDAVFQYMGLKFHQSPRRILELSMHPDEIRWLPGCKMNIADLALSMGDPDDVAVIWAQEPDCREVHAVTWDQLRAFCRKVAIAVQSMFKPGTAIAINMPMTYNSLGIYLGTVLAGCTVVSIADSFAPPEVASRMKIARATAIFTQDVVIRSGKRFPLYARAVEAGVSTVIVLPGDGCSLQVPLRGSDIAWEDFLKNATDGGSFQPHVCDAYEPTNILFSSGTTGEPKAIPWTHVTPIRCAVDGWANQDVRHRDVVCWPTNLGWMMGPWLVYAALINRAAIALYQGSPLGRDFCEFVASARVTMLGVVPSIVRSWRQNRTTEGLDWSSIRCFSSTGEASTPEEYHWLTAQAGYKPVMEYCGGTEIGGGFFSGCMLQPQCPSTFSTPTLGSKIVLLSNEGEQSPHGDPAPTQGELALAPPFLGSSQRLLNRDHSQVYYSQMPCLTGTAMPLRRHGDEVERLPGGWYIAHGRCDDTMNLGGIKVSSVELERVVMANVDAVKEAAAVGISSSRGGPQHLVLFVVLNEDSPQTNTNSLLKECQVAVRTHLNPLFKVGQVVIRTSLPRTASNKIMRRTLRDELPRSRM